MRTNSLVSKYKSLIHINIKKKINYLLLFFIKFYFLTRPVGLEPTTSGFGNLRSTN